VIVTVVAVAEAGAVTLIPKSTVPPYPVTDRDESAIESVGAIGATLTVNVSVAAVELGPPAAACVAVTVWLALLKGEVGVNVQALLTTGAVPTCVPSMEMVRLVTGAGDELGQRKVFRKEDLSLEAQVWQMSMGKARLKRACTKR